MKILISVDIEGVAGVFNPEQTRAGNPEYEHARRLMTSEANAAIAGARAGGADRITVNDSHGGFRNLLPELLDPGVRVVLGKPRLLGMMGGIEGGADAVMLVGYHARAQTRGILAHTINSFAFSRVWLNGAETGEAGIYGALAGQFSVPVVFGSGDDLFIAETRLIFPEAVFAQTKVANGAYSGESLSPAESCALIAEQVEVAMSRIAGARPYLLATPLVCRLQVQTVALTDLFCQLPLLERLDGVTVEFAAPTVQYVVGVLNSLSAMSAMLRN